MNWQSTPSGDISLGSAVIDNPTDLDRRLILADWLEEEGRDTEAAFQRHLVAFAQLVQEAVRGRGPTTPRVMVGVTEGKVNVRVYTEEYYGSSPAGHKTVYAWIRKSDGAVFRGSWKKPEGPVRFYVAEPQKPAIGPYGLAYLRNS